MKKRLDLKGSKKGATSFYVVIFATLLLSVIVLSFVRIMLSGATKTTNTDLSNSAYDSALAGIEDAKIALARYHKCLDEEGSNGTLKPNENAAVGSCDYLVWSIQQNDCDAVGKALGRVEKTGGEVVIKADTTKSSNNSESMEQAYTCVKITNDVEDYRATVDGGHRVHIVPIRTERADEVASLEFKWSYGGESKTALANTDYKDGKLPAGTGNKTQPVVLDIYQTDKVFTLGELSLSSDVGTDRASLLLVPQKDQLAAKEAISESEVLESSDKADNHPFKIKCGATGEFDCKVNIGVPRPQGGTERNGGTFLARVETPYGREATDFSITAKDKNGNVLKFVGVQAQIDSTGRANDLFRRVDARVDLVDSYFAYPEFATKITKSGDGTKVDKTSWVTRNCWTSDSEINSDNGAQKLVVSGCNNTGSSHNYEDYGSDAGGDYDDNYEYTEEEDPGSDSQTFWDGSSDSEEDEDVWWE